ncbi:hypothetical protein [Amycolatopsis sp. NPDC051372]|uniref:aromatic-ring hydroxylase C-terminal domain-containing protein n=1 Tax=unclassified Amycolatopsis TaxID=2618356 RepID=UPI0034188CB2
MAQTALTQHRGARADALREVITDLLDTPDGATHVVTRISGTWQHYGEGTDETLLGHRVPDLPLDDGTTLAAHFRAGKAVLLDAGANATATAAPWSDRLTITTARPTAFPDQPLAAFIRPDGYVAWVSPGQTDLRAALTTWLGRPRTVGAPT